MTALFSKSLFFLLCLTGDWGRMALSRHKETRGEMTCPRLPRAWVGNPHCCSCSAR